MTGFIVRTQGFAEEAARETARTMMAGFPAWSGKKNVRAS